MLAWYFLMGGDLRGAMREVAELLGRAPLPPRWALGFLQSTRWEGALALARRGDGVHRRDLVARFGVSGEAVRRELVALVNAGLLIRVEQYRGTRYVAASRREKGQEALPKGCPGRVFP